MVPALNDYFKRMKHIITVCFSEKQLEIDLLILNFIVNGMRPLSIVEDKDFLKLCHGNKIIRKKKKI